MSAAHLTLREEDVIRLTLEFLHSRNLHISQVSLEHETGVINGQYSYDVFFLRQLILDGQWDDVLAFIQPLEALPDFDMKKFTYSILKHKYIELLCIRSEADVIGECRKGSMDYSMKNVLKVLKDLEKVVPSEDEYGSLCFLLAFPRPTDHKEYKDWNPSNARVQCFREVHPLVEKFLPGDRKSNDPDHPVSLAMNDRLIQLIIKGILYESCVNYCQAKASGSKESEQVEMNFSRILDGSVGFSDSDLSLLSWLQSIPPETFAVPFAQRTLNVNVERLEKPSLETTWIRPNTFPYSAMSSSRPRSAADMMSRSLVPALEAGLGPRSPGPKNTPIPSDINPMSRSSSASFHLTGFKNNKLMNTSVDRLFENEGDVSLSSSYAEFQQLPSIQETTANSQPKAPPRTRAQSKSPETIKADPSATSTPERRIAGRESPAPLTARSSSRDSLAEKQNEVAAKTTEPTATQPRVPLSGEHFDQDFNFDVLEDFETEKQRLQKKFQQREKEWNDLLRLGGTPRESVLNDGDSLAEKPTGVAAKITKPLAQPWTYLSDVPFVQDPNFDPVEDFRRNNQGLEARFQDREREWYELLKLVGLRRSAQMVDNRLQNDVMKQPVGSKGPSAVHTSTRSRSGIQSPKPVLNESEMMVRQNSVLGNTFDARVQESHYDVVKPIKQEPRQELDTRNGSSKGGKSKFVPVTTLEDVQAVRCAEFHPHGKLYAVGSNSKTLRLCCYAKVDDIREDHQTYQPTVLFKRTKHHKGSIYCLAWTPDGQLIATGSNDKTVKLMRFNSDTSHLEAQEVELTMHDGTVRDLCFLEDTSNKSSLLISGGAGDCKIYVTDCATGTPFQALSGHSGHVLTLYNWGGAMFVSGSQDKTVRFWDLRTRGCVNMVTPATVPGSRVGSPVGALCVDPSGRLLVSGHEDSSCVLFDIRGGRTVQCFKPHAADIRSIRFSPSAYYLLTGGYDNKLVLTDLQGDLTMPLPSVVVAQHQDKVISGRWHPTEFSFLSTSADKTATLWTLPPV